MKELLKPTKTKIIFSVIIFGLSCLTLIPIPADVGIFGLLIPIMILFRPLYTLLFSLYAGTIPFSFWGLWLIVVSVFFIYFIFSILTYLLRKFFRKEYLEQSTPAEKKKYAIIFVVFLIVFAYPALIKAFAPPGTTVFFTQNGQYLYDMATDDHDLSHCEAIKNKELRYKCFLYAIHLDKEYLIYPKFNEEVCSSFTSIQKSCNDLLKRKKIEEIVKQAKDKQDASLCLPISDIRVDYAAGGVEVEQRLFECYLEISPNYVDNRLCDELSLPSTSSHLIYECKALAKYNEIIGKMKSINNYEEARKFNNSNPCLEIPIAYEDIIYKTSNELTHECQQHKMQDWFLEMLHQEKWYQEMLNQDKK